MLYLIKRWNHKITRTFIIAIYFLTPLVFYSQILDPVLLPRYLLLAILISLISFYYIIINSSEIQFQLRKTINSKLFLTYMGLWLVSSASIYLTHNTGDGLFEFLKLTIYLSFLAIISLLFNNRKNIDIAIKTLLLMVVLLFIIGLYQVYIIKTDSSNGLLWIYGKQEVEAVFANKNIYSQVCFLLLSFSMYASLCYKGIWRRIGCLDIILLLSSIIYLQTKHVWIALLIAPIILLIIGCIYRGYLIQLIPRKLCNYKTVVWAFTILLLIGCVFLFNKYERIYDVTHFVVNFDTQEQIRSINTGSSLYDRTLMLKNTLSMIKDNWITGVGIGNWSLLFPSYGIGGTEFLNTGNLRFQRPHNDFLLTFAETGVLGFVFYCFIFFFSITYVIYIIKRTLINHDKVLALCLFFGIAGYVVIAWFSFPKERIFVSVLFLTLLGMLLSMKGELTPFKSKKGIINCNCNPIYILYVIILFSVVSISWGLNRFDKEVHLYKAYYAKLYKQWNIVRHEIDRADSFVLKSDPTGTPLYWYAGLANYEQQKVDDALNYFLKAGKINPFHINVLNDIASCYMIKGDYNKAILYYEKALKITPCFRMAALNLAITYYNKGEIENACTTFSKSCLLKDFYSDDYRKAINTIFGKKLWLTMNEVENTNTKESLQKLLDDKDLMFSLFIQSIKKNIDFDNILKEYLNNEV